MTSDLYQFVIPDKFQPYTRMTQRGKYVKPSALAYLASQDRLRWLFKQQMMEAGYPMLPGQTPLKLYVTISPADHRRDLSNELKALEDAMNKIVYPDDRWIDRFVNVERFDGGIDETVVSIGVI